MGVGKHEATQAEWTVAECGALGSPYPNAQAQNSYTRTYIAPATQLRPSMVRDLSTATTPAEPLHRSHARVMATTHRVVPRHVGRNSPAVLLDHECEISAAAPLLAEDPGRVSRGKPRVPRSLNPLYVVPMCSLRRPSSGVPRACDAVGP